MTEATIGHNEPKNKDWIAVYRSLRTHPIVGFLQEDRQTVRKGVVVCESMAWIDLCMLANWKDLRENNQGQPVIVERGQLQGARNWLAARWGWTQDKVRWFLKKLHTDGMIALSAPTVTQEKRSKNSVSTKNRTQSNTRKRAHYNNVITICNYDIYQTAVELEKEMSAQPNTQSTPNQPPINTHTVTREQDNSNSDVHARDRVEVNCEALHLHFGGKSKRLPFSTIDLWAAAANMPAEKARMLVQAKLEGWIVDGKLPPKPSDELQRSLRYAQLDTEVGRQRLKNEQDRGKPKSGSVPIKLDDSDRPKTKPRPREEVEA